MGFHIWDPHPSQAHCKSAGVEGPVLSLIHLNKACCPEPTQPGSLNLQPPLSGSRAGALVSCQSSEMSEGRRTKACRKGSCSGQEQAFPR